MEICLTLHRFLWKSRLNLEELSLLVQAQDPVFISIVSFILIKTKRRKQRQDMFSSKGIACNPHVTFFVSVTKFCQKHLKGGRIYLIHDSGSTVLSY